MELTVKRSADECSPGDYVENSLVKDWPRMSDKACIAFRRFTGIGKEGYNLVRKGPRIFAVGSDLAKCVYNHTREF